MTITDTQSPALAEAPAGDTFHLEDAFEALDRVLDEIKAALDNRVSPNQLRSLLVRLELRLPQISYQFQELIENPEIKIARGH